MAKNIYANDKQRMWIIIKQSVKNIRKFIKDMKDSMKTKLAKDGDKIDLIKMYLNKIFI